MGSMPTALLRTRDTLVPMAGLVRRLPKAPIAMARISPPAPPTPPGPLADAMALPPIPLGYILLLFAMVSGVLALHAQGATYKEAVATVDALLLALGLFAWKLNK